MYGKSESLKHAKSDTCIAVSQQVLAGSDLMLLEPVMTVEVSQSHSSVHSSVISLVWMSSELSAVAYLYLFRAHFNYLYGFIVLFIWLHCIISS